MGGYDIFYSTLLDNGEWSIPLNVGYPLNTTDDDVFSNHRTRDLMGIMQWMVLAVTDFRIYTVSSFSG